jgi:uncharacterized protein (DUF488 family)
MPETRAIPHGPAGLTEAMLAPAGTAWQSEHMDRRGIIGIGYEGRSAGQVVDELVARDIGVLFDVRLTPLSRKPGLSKTALSGRLSTVGIAYLHLPELGNPKWNRAGFGGAVADRDAARANFRERLDQPAALAALHHIRTLATNQPVAVLCFESDADRCHRTLVIDAVESLVRSH